MPERSRRAFGSVVGRLPPLGPQERGDALELCLVEPRLKPGKRLQLLVARISHQGLVMLSCFPEGASVALLVVEDEIPLLKEGAHHPEMLAYRTLEEPVEFVLVFVAQVIGTA